MKLLFYLSLFFILFLNELYSQANVLPNGNFEIMKSNKSNSCLETSNGAASSWNEFDSYMEYWQTARHSISASNKNNDVGHINIFNSLGCNPTSSGMNCASFPTTANYQLTSPNRFVRIRADYHKCRSTTVLNQTTYNIKKKHGAIAVALLNGSTFSQGTSYRIRYKVVPLRSVNNDNKGGVYCSNDNNAALYCHLRFFLSEYGPASWNENASDKQELYSVNYTEALSVVVPDITDCKWKQVERVFSPNQNNYTTLVIFAESGGACIDDVEVFEECEPYKYVQNKFYGSPMFAAGAIDGYNFGEKASINLHAGNNVNSNQSSGDIWISNGTKINYTAGHEIILSDGVLIQNGADFTAVILPCPNNLNKGQEPVVNLNPDPNYVPLPPLLSDEEAERIQAITDDINDFTSFFDIFPNPGNGLYTFRAQDLASVVVNLKIYNELGQEILILKNIDDGTIIDLQAYSKGIYLAVINVEGNIVRKKIVQN